MIFKPAKITQQEEVLAELQEHTNSSNNKPKKETFSYLNARNLIYENDFQSMISVLNIDSNVMCNSVKDYQYFEDWLKEIKHHNPAFVATSSKGCRLPFLAWQP